MYSNALTATSLHSRNSERSHSAVVIKGFCMRPSPNSTTDHKMLISLSAVPDSGTNQCQMSAPTEVESTSSTLKVASKARFLPHILSSRRSLNRVTTCADMQPFYDNFEHCIRRPMRHTSSSLHTTSSNANTQTPTNHLTSSPIQSKILQPPSE